MKNHTKVYLKAMGLSALEFIPCEVCNSIHIISNYWDTARNFILCIFTRLNWRILANIILSNNNSCCVNSYASDLST